MGRARAKQTRQDDHQDGPPVKSGFRAKSKSLPIIIHGDAAYAGQGILG